MATENLSDYFSEMYSTDADPYQVESRWYEQRKIGLLMSALPSRHYQSAYEPGCGTGFLSIELAKRCTFLHISDASHEAMTTARTNVQRITNISCAVESLPTDWPGHLGKFDLIIFSELLYFLDEDQLMDVISLSRLHLMPNGHIAVCNWKPDFAFRKLETDLISSVFKNQVSLYRIVHHEEADFILDVYSANPKSVASLEGIL